RANLEACAQGGHVESRSERAGATTGGKRGTSRLSSGLESKRTGLPRDGLRKNSSASGTLAQDRRISAIRSRSHRMPPHNGRRLFHPQGICERDFKSRSRIGPFSRTWTNHDFHCPVFPCSTSK